MSAELDHFYNFTCFATGLECYDDIVAGDQAEVAMGSLGRMNKHGRRAR
jgi:hypothetical protein